MSEQNTENQSIEEVKEKVIGEFKPKRKFLNFVSAVNGARVRLISDIAFIKGEKLSGLGLEGVIFKVTICDEGTINFEEMETSVTDTACRKRLIDDICDAEVTGYAMKFIASGLQFADKDGRLCYLEVENAKPIDKLKSLFDEMDKPEISEKGMSFLDDLLGGSTEEETTSVEEVVVEPVVEAKAEEKSHAATMMEEAFRKMNEDKVIELKSRIEDTEKDIKRAQNEASQAEKKIKTSDEQLRILNSRLETMYPGDEPNGHVFLVSDEQKLETGLDETTRDIADKIADIMNLKKDILFKYLTGSFYKIKIGKKGENDKKLETIEKETYLKVLSIDPLGKFSQGADVNEIEYRGELNWHQLTGKMIRRGFEQDPEFDKISGSNSYEAKTEDDGKNFTGTKTGEEKEFCSHDNCGCGTLPAVVKEESASIVRDGKLNEVLAPIASIDKFENFEPVDEDDAEAIMAIEEEFEEENGFAMGNEWIFSIYYEPTASNLIDDPQCVLAIQPKSYWDNNKCHCDLHLEGIIRATFPSIKAMGDRFEEPMECSFQMSDFNGTNLHTAQCLSVSDCVEILCKAGIKPCKDFQDMMSSKDTQLLINTVTQLGYQNLIC